MSSVSSTREHTRFSSSASHRSSTSSNRELKQAPLYAHSKRRSTTAPISTSFQPPAPADKYTGATVARPIALPESDHEVVDREQADVLEEIVLAVNMRCGARGAMGVCYYIARDERLYVVNDVQVTSLEALEMIKLQVQPTVVLIPSRIDESVETCLDPELRTRGLSECDDSQLCLPYILQTRPSPEFGYESGARRLIDLVLPAGAFPQTKLMVPGHEDPYESYEGSFGHGYTSRQGRLLRLNSLVDMESRLSIGCAGAVLTYLQHKRAGLFLPGDMDAELVMRVTSLETVALDGFMLLNSDTLASLQILQSESHPNSYNQGPSSSGAKEDLSIYGLFHNLAKTPQGKRLLRQWFLRPSLNLTEIIERQDTTSLFLHPNNEIHMDEIVTCLKQIKNMKTVMLHLRKGMSDRVGKGGGIKNGIWSTIRSFAYHTIGICGTFEQIPDARQLLIGAKVLERFEKSQLALLGRAVTEIVDFATSAEAHRTVVKPGVDEELDKMKRDYDGMESLLSEASINIASTIPCVYGLDLNVVFFPQIGFLICMPVFEQTGRAEWEGCQAEGGAWERIFSTQERVYYKDCRMAELDERIGDVYAKICDKEIEIIHELAQRVLEYEEMLCELSEICGELDCLLALAQGAKLYRLARPCVTLGNDIQVREGRHLLQEYNVPSYIVNDTMIVGELDPAETVKTSQSDPLPLGPSMLVLTGPNFSGKSIYLKQVAQIVYLAHVGCFVPATHATIGLTDKILTRVATRESVSRPLSSFAIDLQQISSALNLATRRSLLIIDEFGKGTDAADGAGLMCGVLEHLLNREPLLRPKVLAATHFHELFEANFLKPRPGLAFAHMDVHVDKEAIGVEEQVTYLYSLRPGRSLASFGTVCAALNGIDQAIIDRAEDLIELDARGGDLVAAFSSAKNDNGAQDDEEDADSREVEDIARAFLSRDFQPLRSNGDVEKEDTCSSEVEDGGQEQLREFLEGLV